MKNILLPAFLITCLFFVYPAHARDFTVDDFDPVQPAQPDDPDNPDAPTMAEIYGQAVLDLMNELIIVASDDDGNKLFQVYPFPMELVALLTQTSIFTGEITDPDELAALVDQANAYKPAMNSFTISLEGSAEWVGRNVSIYYISEEDGSTGTMIPVYQIAASDPSEEGAMFSEWALLAETMDELAAFLAAPRVLMVIGDDDESGEIILECGFWRQWALFDFRTDEENDELDPEESDRDEELEEED